MTNHELSITADGERSLNSINISEKYLLQMVVNLSQLLW